MPSARHDSDPPTVGELLERVGVSTADGTAVELPHNRRLTPAVWRVAIEDGRAAVLKYLRADRDRGETDWDAHWTVSDQLPDACFDHFVSAEQLPELEQIIFDGYLREGEIDATFKFRERSHALLFISEWARKAIALADQVGL